MQSGLLAAVVAAALAAPAFTQPAAPPAQPDAPPLAQPGVPSAACCHVSAGTVVEIELTQAVSSKVQKQGSPFGLRLAEPLSMNGKVLMPAGAAGSGEVIDAAPSGMGGRSGKLVLAARYVDSGGVRLSLRGFKLGGSGKNRLTETLVVEEAVGIVGILIQGGDLVYPEGTRAFAKVAADIDLPPVADESAGVKSAAPDSASPVPSQQGSSK